MATSPKGDDQALRRSQARVLALRLVQARNKDTEKRARPRSLEVRATPKPKGMK